MTRTISRAEIKELLDGDKPLVLVETLRTEHFEMGHLPGAVHLHPDDVADRAAAVLPDRHVPIVTYCSNVACSHSRVVAEHLTRLGYTDVRRYEQGKDDWMDAGLPVEAGGVPTT